LAERIVLDSGEPEHALVGIAALAAVNDTAQAERITYAIFDPESRCRALVAPAKLHPRQ
jgi:hypothetical protein